MCAMCTVVSFINVPASLLINAAISIINIFMYVYIHCARVCHKLMMHVVFMHSSCLN